MKSEAKCNLKSEAKHNKNVEVFEESLKKLNKNTELFLKNQNEGIDKFVEMEVIKHASEDIKKTISRWFWKKH